MPQTPKTRTYAISINGVEESINAVDSLNKKLESLEERMNALSKVANVKINTGSDGKLADSTEESKRQKEILSTTKEISQEEKNIAKTLEEQRQIRKQVRTEAKEALAAERLSTGGYGNTMAGLKQELNDVKAVMQHTNLDSTEFQDLTNRAAELTTKLKELEQAYGVFGRSVGQYQTAFDAPAFQKLQITVNGVVREFNNAKEALRTLKNERDTLSLMKQDVGDLDEVVKTLQSDIKDMDKSSAGMDMMLDSMQGVLAIASTAKGISALFGLDDDAIEESIQKLVALQNILQGLETVRKQMQTGEGVGKLLSRGNDAIDNFVNKLFRLDKAQKAVATSTSGATTATKAASTAQKAANTTTETLATTTNTLTVAQRAATAAATALSWALKAIGWGIVIAGITALMDLYDKWVDKQKQAKEAQEKFNDIILEGGKAATEAQAKMQMWQDRITKFNGTQEQARKLVQQLNKEYGDSIGKYKTLAEWKRQLTDRGAQYIKMLEAEAKAQASLAVYTQAAQDAMKASLKGPEEYLNWFDKAVGVLGTLFNSEKLTGFAVSNAFKRQSKDIADSNAVAKRALKDAKEYQKQADEIRKQFSFNEYSSADGKAKSQQKVDELKHLNELEIQAMEDGLAKILAQLDKERSQRLDQAKKTGEDEELIKQIYRQKELAARRKFDDQMIAEQQRFYNESRALDKENFERTKADLANSYEVAADWEKRIFNQTLKDTGAYMYKTHNRLRQEVETIISDIDVLTNGAFDKEKNQNNLIEGASFDVAPDTGNIVKSIREVYDIRLAETKRLYDVLNERRSEFMVDYEKEQEQIDKQYQDDRTALINSNNAFLIAAEEWYRKRKEQAEINGEDIAQVEAEYDKIMNDQAEAFEKGLTTLQTEWENKRIQNAREREKILFEVYKERYDAILEEERSFATAIDTELNEAINNARTKDVFSFIKPAEIKKARKEAIENLDQLVQDLLKTREDLAQDWVMGNIDDETYMSKLKEVETEIEIVFNRINENKSKLLSGADVSELLNQVNQYAQLVGQGLNSILTSVWDYQDSLHQRMMKDLNDAIDAQEAAYQKQQEITQQYAENVNSIEDELSNSRGDRRQELIDQLNAQMEAQRASIAEEKRIENEKKALERKAEQEDLKQKKRQHKRDLVQAVINGALAVSNALTTKPFIPMALIAAGIAAATSAVQIGLIAKAKYAKGGQLEGKSHAQGGIPVGNTGIEVEGKEYIIRKESTQPNIGLLDYINKSKRKLTLEDFIDYYDKPSKIRQNVSKMKFAEGGIMPAVETSTRRGSDEVIDAIDRLANRPYYVSVAEINNVQDRVGRVQALAGKE